MPELTVSIVAHALLGIALAVAVWAIGLGYVRRLRGGELFAYAFGLLAASVACLLFLITPWLTPVAAVLVIAPLTQLRAGRPVAARAASPLAWALVPALGLGIALGFLNHGPTADVDSSAYGDMLFYAAKTVSAAQSVFPLRDLLVEGEHHVWVETAWTFLTAPLSKVPGVDVVLLQAATAPAFAVTAVVIGIGLLRQPAHRSPWLAAVALVAVALTAYPTWLTESPPVALAAPLAFSLYGLWRDRLPTGWFAAVAGVVAIDCFLAKGFGLIPLGVLAGAALVRDHVGRAVPYAIGAAAIAVVGAVVFVSTSAWLTDLLGLKFLPADAVRGLHRQLDTRDTHAVAPAFLVAGQVLLGAALFRSRAYALLAALATAVAGNWFVGGHGVDITVGLSVLVAAIYYFERPAELERSGGLVVAAGACLAVSCWFRDIAGARAGFLLVGLLGLGLLGAFVRRLSPAVLAAAALVALALVLGTGNRRTTLTTADYELWRDVSDVVPASGLVYTNETGPRITGDEGWNYYPGVAGRQVYLAGWSDSPLLVDRSELARRLALNRRVLSGRLGPEAADLDERYGSYFAVVRGRKRVPGSFRLVLRDGDLALYRIES
jgi:hypothetical protein